MTSFTVACVQTNTGLEMEPAIAALMISVNFALSAVATRLERRLRRSGRAPRQLEAAALEPGD